MKALVLHAPHEYRLETNWHDPQNKPGHSIVRVHYCGICGSDLPRFGDAGSYSYPIILGHEFTGTVESSEFWEKGTRVAVLPIIPCGTCKGCRSKLGAFHCEKYEFLGSRSDGGMAQYCLVPDKNLIKLDDAGLKEGTLIEPLAVALHAARISGLRYGMSAAVIGAGTIGLLIALWLREFGASRVMIADIKESARIKAKTLGFSHIIDPLQNEITELEGADVAIDAAGSSESLKMCIGLANPGGKICVIGRNTRETIIPAAQFERFMRKELNLSGIWGYDTDGEIDVMEHMFSHRAKELALLIEKEVPLAKACQIIDDYVIHNQPYIKTVISFI